MYQKLTPFIHLITQKADRQQAKLEFIYSSGGSWFEKPEDRGKKHLLEHCIASRTADLDFQGLKDLTFAKSINLNAYTGDLVMALTASGHKMDIEEMITITLEMLLNPTFDNTILEREKQIVLRELSERMGDPNYRLFYEVQRAIFTPDSLEVHEVGGDPAMVAKTTLEDFEQLHKQNIANSHLLLCISGGGLEDQEHITNIIREYIDKSEYRDIIYDQNAKNPVNVKAKNEFLPFKVKAVVSDLAHEHAEVTVFIPCSITFDNAPAITIFDNLFMKWGGILYDRLRDELQLVYGINVVFRQDIQMAEIAFACEIKYIEQIVNEINQTFSNFEKYFNVQKFEEFKLIIRKKIDMARDTLGSETKFVAERLLNYGKEEVYDQYVARLEKVTQQDIEDIYNEIKNHLSNKRVVGVSKDQSLEEVMAKAEY